MMLTLFPYASLTTLLCLTLASAQSTPTQYAANTNANCATASDVDYQATYSYNATDTMDWGFYTQSQGACDSGSYARVHVIDPSGNDIQCGYVALDGNLHLVSCSNYPRGYMGEGQYTVLWETVPGINQYSWNQFNVVHKQSTVTAATPTQTVTTTPILMATSTVTSVPTSTLYVAQVTVTNPSATVVNTVIVTPNPTTITTTSTSYYSISIFKYAQATVTAVATASCRHGSITNDYTGSWDTSVNASGNKTTSYTSPWAGLFSWLWRRSRYDVLVVRDGDVPNTVGMIGQPLTTTVVPAAVVQTVTAAAFTSIVTTTTLAPGVSVTSTNPTPTVTVYSGVAAKTTTLTRSQVTKSVVKNTLSIVYVTTTSTVTYTKNVTTTPICAPSSI